MVKQYYKDNVANKLNELMNLCFQCNLVADDIAYQLCTILNEDEVGNLFHHHIAHFFTGDFAADFMSDVMIKSNIQPKRSALKDNNVTYKSVADAFDANVKLFEQLREKIIITLDELEMKAENRQLCVKLEDFLEVVVDMLRKSNIMSKKADEYETGKDLYQFELWLKDFLKD